MSRRRIGLALRLLGLAIVAALGFGALAGAQDCGSGYGSSGYSGYLGRHGCDRTPPATTVKVPKQRRAAVLRHGVAASVTCSEACTARLALTLDRSGARTLKLGRKPLVAGRATVTFSGSMTVRIELAKAVRKALRHGHRAVSFELTGTVTDGAGNRATLPARTVDLTR